MMTKEQIVARMPRGATVTEVEIDGDPSFLIENDGRAAIVSIALEEPWFSHAIDGVRDMMDPYCYGVPSDLL
jgi:hypothetical protein